jgi:hypothetical protein
MRFRTFRSVLDECLDSVRRGESVEACLERYPKHAERLRPLLTLSVRVQRVPAVHARPWAQATAWDLVRQRATELRSGKRRRATGGTGVSAGIWLRPIAVAMALMLAIFAGGGATALASQSALPDSPLYRVKLFTEDARLWFVFDDSREAEILLDQSDERMDEMLTMARKGKPIPSNVLSAMESRHSRAAALVADLSTEDSDRPDLLRRLLEQSASQEGTLLSLWDGVSPGGRDEYTEVVAVLHNTRLQGSTELVLSSEDLIGGVREIDGVAVLTDGVWTIGGIPVVVDERTIGGRELEDGATARGVFGQASDGTLRALSLISVGSPPAFVSGAVEEVTDEGIRIAGQWITFDSSTIVRKDLKLGDRVQVELAQSEFGTVASTVSGVAEPVDRAEKHSLTFVGTIESPVSGADEVVVSGVTFTILENAKIDASSRPAEEGVRAIIEASYSGGTLSATGITILSADEDAGAIFLAGTYQGATEGRWDVSGVRMNPPEGAEDPVVGAVISVDARRADGGLHAEEFFVIEQPGEDPITTVSSTIKKVTGNHWDIGIVGEVRVNKDAHVVGEPDAGDRILVWGRQSDNQGLQATYVRVLE